MDGSAMALGHLGPEQGGDIGEAQEPGGPHRQGSLQEPGGTPAPPHAGQQGNGWVLARSLGSEIGGTLLIAAR